jgi:hypothetical protein
LAEGLRGGVNGDVVVLAFRAFPLLYEVVLLPVLGASAATGPMALDGKATTKQNTFGTATTPSSEREHSASIASSSSPIAPLYVIALTLLLAGKLERFMNVVRVVQPGYPFPQGGRSLARLWRLQAEPLCMIAG